MKYLLDVTNLEQRNESTWLFETLYATPSIVADRMNKQWEAMTRLEVV